MNYLIEEELKQFIINYVFLDVKIQQQKGNIKIIARSGDEPGTSCIAVWRVTFGPLIISIVVKLFNWLNVMSRNINKQSLICGPYFFNKIVVSVFFFNVHG